MIIAPGSTIGVLGSGQLGRMFTIAARQLGYRVHTLSPEDDTPTGQVADKEFKADYRDLDKVREFAAGVQVVTFEFENVPAECTAVAERLVPVRPAGTALHITQNRAREKRFLDGLGIPVAPWALVRSVEELGAAIARIGRPAILKTAGFGYDGKGQVRIDGDTDLAAAWSAAGQPECVLEGFVRFERELSVVCARGVDGHWVGYDPVENTHVRHILDVTEAPATLPPAVVQDALDIARTVCEGLNLVGVLCVEFFLEPRGRLRVNELAPRPHNSGHFTIDACVNSQFEQQVRAVCGLPLGTVDQIRPAAMVNLLGDLWEGGDPRWNAALECPNVKLHLYGKAEPRPGRKMGHITALAPDPAEAVRQARRARHLLTEKTT